MIQNVLKDCRQNIYLFFGSSIIPENALQNNMNYFIKKVIKLKLKTLHITHKKYAYWTTQHYFWIKFSSYLRNLFLSQVLTGITNIICLALYWPFNKTFMCNLTMTELEWTQNVGKKLYICEYLYILVS